MDMDVSEERSLQRRRVSEQEISGSRRQAKLVSLFDPDDGSDMFLSELECFRHITKAFHYKTLALVDLPRTDRQDIERRMASSGMLSRAAFVRTDVSEELSASIIMVTRIREQEQR
jgi:hypothetical protein